MSPMTRINYFNGGLLVALQFPRKRRTGVYDGIATPWLPDLDIRDIRMIRG
jgi:hypothetical protein